MTDAALHLEPIPLTPAESRRDEWRRIERAAKDEALAEVDVLETQPLEFGQHIAWVYVRSAHTDDLSPLHRVGIPKLNAPYTTCGEPIPHPLRCLPLNTGMVKTMNRCRFCQAEYARLLQEQVA